MAYEEARAEIVKQLGFNFKAEKKNDELDEARDAFQTLGLFLYKKIVELEKQGVKVDYEEFIKYALHQN